MHFIFTTIIQWNLFITVILAWDHAKWLLYRGGLLIEVGGALGILDCMNFGTYPTGWHIEGDLLNQVAISKGTTVLLILYLSITPWIDYPCTNVFNE